jgi:uncharacterized protein (DUF1015 family)
MSSIRPFRALRPLPAQAADVSAVPYDVVNAAEAAALAAGNPLSYLRVSRAEIELPADTNPYADVVYATAAANFARLRAAAPLVVEDAPALYLYRLRMGAHVQTGIAATFAVDEYEQDVILKHEKTRKDKEDDRTRHIVELRAQTGPVFLTYPADATIDALVEAATEGPTARAPLFDFTAPDGVAHTVWPATGDEASRIVEIFGGIPKLYIADGHHRAASAMRARHAIAEAGTGAAAEGKAGDGRTEAEWFLAVAFPHDQMQILPYHRVVKDLNGHAPVALLERIRDAGIHVEPGGDTPAGPGEVAMYLDGGWHRLLLAPAGPGTSPADRLDVSLLHEQVLAPLLGIGDPRTDKRIDFVGGIRGPQALVDAVDGGTAAVAFAMHPTRIEDLMGIADTGGIMPPKSTWFEPKLRDGLLVHLI